MHFTYVNSQPLKQKTHTQNMFSMSHKDRRHRISGQYQQCKLGLHTRKKAWDLQSVPRCKLRFGTKKRHGIFGQYLGCKLRFETKKENIGSPINAKGVNWGLRQERRHWISYQYQGCKLRFGTRKKAWDLWSVPTV
jgi:hypothetical protein